MTFLGSDTIVVLRAVVVVDSVDLSSYLDWNLASATSVAGCKMDPFILSPAESKEVNKDRLFAQSHMRLFAPPTIDILYTDRVRFDGLTYDVHGTPHTWKRFSGEKHHVEVVLRWREG